MQGSLSESVYDPVARRNWRASQELERASTLSAKDARELVVIAVAGTYLQTVATAARIESQRAQVANAQAVYDQALIRKQAGTNARIDVMRTLVELQTQKQRLNSLESDFRTQKLALARAIGLPLDREITLTEPLAPDTIPIPEPAAAVQQALAQRSDLQAAEAQVRAAEHAVDAARAERLPSVSFNGDYGVLGPNPAQTHGVFTVTGSVNVPVWTGGRIKADDTTGRSGPPPAPGRTGRPARAGGAGGPLRPDRAGNRHRPAASWPPPIAIMPPKRCARRATVSAWA